MIPATGGGEREEVDLGEELASEEVLRSKASSMESSSLQGLEWRSGGKGW